jgi:hypothetical protein
MKFLTREQVFDRVRKQGSVIFEKDSRPYNLNIIAIRTKTPKLDDFGCQLMIAWKYNGEWFDESYHITTLPGRYYLIDKLLSPHGTAILAPGQYKGIYALRLHNNKYEALCQTHGPVKVFRDKNRNSTFDLIPSRTFMGMYGINVHNSPDGQVTRKVGSNSAGCLVFSDDKEFFRARDLWRLSRNEFGNKFTLTLVNE